MVVHESTSSEWCEVLQGSTLADLSSPYLSRGLSQDEHGISRVEIRNKHIRATCCLPNYYLSPTDTSFHMSLLNAGALTSQVGIIHCLRLNGYRTKPFEIWMNDFMITFIRPVRDPQRIDVEMEIFARSTTGVRGTGKPKKIFYRWRFDICHGSAWGTLSLCMPDHKESTENRSMKNRAVLTEARTVAISDALTPLG